MAEIRLEGVGRAIPGPESGTGNSLPGHAGGFILREINAIIPENGFSVILGPSGSGKTTLLNLVAGVLPPTEGKVLFDGQDVTGMEPFARNVGYVFQEYSLFPNMTVLANVSFGLEMRKVPRKQAERIALDSLERAGMAAAAGRYPANLSGGEKQRVALVRSLAYQPSVVLLDEPFSNLDPITASELRGQMSEIRQVFPASFLMVTHSREEAVQLADTLIILNEGRVVETGKAMEVMKRPARLFTARFLGCDNVIPCKFDGVTAAVEGLGRFSAASRIEPREVSWCALGAECFGPSEAGGVNSFAGTVMSVDQLAQNIRITVRAEEGALIQWLATPGALPCTPSPGDRVVLRIRPEDVHCVKD